MEFHGHVQIIFGPMFSGKTTELLRRIRRYTYANRRCIVVKYAKDTRYSKDNASTHDKLECPAVGCTTLSQFDEPLDNFDVIGIDEGQFFPDIVSFADSMATAGKIVIVAALDGTFQRKPFGNVLELIPMSEKITKLNSVCMMCFNEASFTKRLGNEMEVEVIGGSEKYVAVCRKCFLSSSTKVAKRSPLNSKRIFALPIHPSENDMAIC